jgi:hypothetical protein
MIFHIGIAVIMGMVSFAIVMMGLDLFLISDQEYVQIWQQGQLFLTNLARLPGQAYRIFKKPEKSLLEGSEGIQIDYEETLKIDEEEGDRVVHERSA